MCSVVSALCDRCEVIGRTGANLLIIDVQWPMYARVTPLIRGIPPCYIWPVGACDVVCRLCSGHVCVVLRRASCSACPYLAGWLGGGVAPSV